VDARVPLWQDGIQGATRLLEKWILDRTDECRHRVNRHWVRDKLDFALLTVRPGRDMVSGTFSGRIGVVLYILGLCSAAWLLCGIVLYINAILVMWISPKNDPTIEKDIHDGSSEVTGAVIALAFGPIILILGLIDWWTSKRKELGSETTSSETAEKTISLENRLRDAVSPLGERGHIISDEDDLHAIDMENCILIVVCAWSAPSWIVLKSIISLLVSPGNNGTDLYVMDCEKWNSLGIWEELGDEGEHLGVPQSPGWGEFACIHDGEVVGKGKWDHTIKGKPGLDQKMLRELISKLNKPRVDRGPTSD